MVGSNPIWLAFLWKEDIWTHKETSALREHREKAMWGHSKKVAIWKPREEDSEEILLSWPWTHL